MSAHMSLSVSVAVMGAIATYVSTGVIPDYYSVWIGFIAWAAFLANNNCMKTTVQSGVMGAVLAAVAFILMGKLGSAAWVVPVSVGVTVFALVWLTSMPMFTSACVAVPFMAQRSDILTTMDLYPRCFNGVYVVSK